MVEGKRGKGEARERGSEGKEKRGKGEARDFILEEKLKKIKKKKEKKTCTIKNLSM